MTKQRLVKIASITLMGMILTALSMPASGEKDNPLPILQTKAKTLAIFKNGLGFFIREGEVELHENWAVTKYVPQAALGSLWIGSLDKDAQLEEVIGFFEDVKSEGEAITLQELLHANVGKKAKITAHNQIIEGIIKSIPENREPYQESAQQRVQPYQGLIVIISTKEGDIAINKNAISKIEFSPGYSKRILSQRK